MEEMKDFEALVNAIKESSQPTMELAAILKKQFSPVQTTKLRSYNFDKVTIGDKSFQVSYDTYESTGLNRTFVYSITNEIASASDCVVLSKGMTYEYKGLRYTLSKVAVANDTLLVIFDLTCDEVLIS